MVNRKWVPMAMVLVATLACSSMALAGQLSIGGSPYRATGFGGGEFVIYDYSGFPVAPISDAAHWDKDGEGDKDEFQTFCLERNEYLKTNVKVDSPDVGAVMGGLDNDAYDLSWDVNGSTNFDPISLATAYLYGQFWAGQLSDYDYDDNGVGRDISAQSLQLAIWTLEDEVVTTNTQALAWITEAVDEIDAGNVTDIGGVRVLNIYVHDTAGDVVHKQSQLVVVPLPASALMGLGLLCAIGAYRGLRRKNRV